MEMGYRRRTIILILIWIILALIMAVQTVYFGFGGSLEAANRTIKGTLIKVKETFPDLVDNEVTLLEYYNTADAKMGNIIPLLQVHGLEETIPSQKNLKKYARLLDANYIAIQDKNNKTISSYGKFFHDENPTLINGEEDMTTWITSADSMISKEKDYSNYTMILSEDISLFYQIHNEETNRVQNQAFSWRAVLNNITLPGDARLIVISKKDDKILVHPKSKVIGKSYEALGYKSKKDFFSSFNAPDQDGIAYHKGILQTVRDTGYTSNMLSDMSAFDIGSGFIDCGSVLVLCVVNQKTFSYYLKQERGLLTIYILGSLLVLCYILFRFRQQRRIRKEALKSGKPLSAGGMNEQGICFRMGFCYERGWCRRLLVCCLFVLLASILLSIHVELLGNSAKMRIQMEQAKELTKTMKKENEQHRKVLDDWYNHISTKLANVIFYAVSQDDSMQSRKSLKQISKVFEVSQVAIYSQDGKTKVTNSDYDHINLYDAPDSRMSKTFLPLLEGMKHNASTPFTSLSDDEKTGKANKKVKSSTIEEVFGNKAFAGVSIRNSHDLCDGCLGIVKEPVTELWGDKGTIRLEGDTYDTVLKLVNVDEDQIEGFLFGKNQTKLIFSMLQLMFLCLALFWSIGVLQRVPRKTISDDIPDDMEEAEFKGEENSDDGFGIEEVSGAVSEEETKETAAHIPSEEKKMLAGLHSLEEEEDLFYSIFGKERDFFFNERWNYDDTPIFRQSPEKQLFFLIKCILVLMSFQIMWMFITRSTSMETNLVTREIFNGSWKQGPNLYAFTASGMLIIVIYVLCMALHRLVYFIAQFSTPRGETVCHLVYSIINYAAVLTGLYYCLTFFGVHARTMLAGAGILGIVISFGAQSTIADILSGIFLIFEDVIHVGDFVRVGSASGIIKNIGVRMTKLQSFGTTISINNSDLKAMENMSTGDGRVSCYLPLDVTEDLARAEEIFNRELPGITERLRETGYITSDICCSGVNSFDENGIVVRFDVFAISYRCRRVARYLNGELIKMCQKNNLRLAYRHSFLMAENE